MNFRFGTQRINIPLWPSISFMLLMPVLIALGLWQLDRAEQKSNSIQQRQSREADGTIALGEMVNPKLEQLKFRKVTVTGSYDVKHQFLVDNQVVSGTAGYFVLTPFRIKDQHFAILVNRGWVANTGDRNLLPDIRFKQSESVIFGMINSFPSVGLKLAGAEIPAEGWPSVVQLVDSTVLEQEIGYPLLDFQLLLDKNQANGYVRNWHIPVTMPPEKHVAYAVQWFGLAATLLVLYLIYGVKCERDR